MTWPHHFEQPPSEGPFPEANAYVNISLTDGTSIEFGFNPRPASGTDDVERALEACETGADVAACLHAFVQRGEAQAGQVGHRHIEWCDLTDDEVERARRIVDQVLGED
jgi:hypothetical protein